MKVRLSLSWMIVSLALLAPIAQGAETATGNVAEVAAGTDAGSEPGVAAGAAAGTADVAAAGNTTDAVIGTAADSAPGADARPVAGAEGAAAAHLPEPLAPSGLQDRVTDEEDESQEPKATKSDVEAVHGEVEVLRDQWQRSLDRAFPYTVVQSNRPLIISGTGQLRYNQTLNSDQNAPSGFTIPFFSLAFTGNLRKDYLEGKNVDYSLGIQTTGTSTISITDAWLSYQLLNSLDKEGPRLSIAGGQQKKNFGNEATATEAFKPTIKVAQFASNLNLDERDLGLVLAGDLLPALDYGYNYRVPLVQYWLAAFNGTGPNTSDNNSQKDFLGRIQFNAPVHYDHPLRGLSLGLSGYRGRKSYTATNTTTTTATFNTNATPPVATTLTTSSSTASITSKGDKNRWGADLAYVNTPVGFTLEWVRGEDLSPVNGTVRNGVATTRVGFNKVIEEGYTFTLFYNFGEQFVNSAKQQDRYDDFYPLTYQPFVRFDRWVPNTSNYGTHTDITTLGFNWFFAQTTKLQFNYNIRTEHPVDKNNDEFLVQFQFGF